MFKCNKIDGSIFSLFLINKCHEKSALYSGRPPGYWLVAGCILLERQRYHSYLNCAGSNFFVAGDYQKSITPSKLIQI